MPITDFARVTLQTALQLITRVGFGTPMIVGSCTAWGASPDRVRAYSSLAGLVSDGFATTDPEYIAAAAILAQRNPPPIFKLGRRLNLPTQQWILTPTAANLTGYPITLDTAVAPFTSDGTATAAEICTGIKAAIDALALGVTTTNEGPGTDVKVVSNVAGVVHYLKAMAVGNPLAPNAFLDIKQNHADPGITADLNAIAAADGNFYAFMLTTQGAAEIAAADAWAVSNGPRVHFALTEDSGCYTSSAADVGTTLNTAARNVTALLYHHDPRQFAAAAWMGFGLPTDPGTENWANMPLVGIEPTNFTAAQLLALGGDPGSGPGGKNVNYFYSPAPGLTATRMGVLSGGQYLDQIRFLASFKIGAEEDIAQLIADRGAIASKLAFDDHDIAAVENLLRARVKAGQDIGAISSDPGLTPTYTSPLASSFTAAQRKLRVLSGIGCTFVLTGAVNLVVEVVTAS